MSADHAGFRDELAEDPPPRAADRALDADLARPLGDAHGHRVDDRQAADDEADRRDADDDRVEDQRGAADLLHPSRSWSGWSRSPSARMRPASSSGSPPGTGYTRIWVASELGIERRAQGRRQRRAEQLLRRSERETGRVVGRGERGLRGSRPPRTARRGSRSCRRPRAPNSRAMSEPSDDDRGSLVCGGEQPALGRLDRPPIEPLVGAGHDAVDDLGDAEARDLDVLERHLDSRLDRTDAAQGADLVAPAERRSARARFRGRWWSRR